ncbi:MAG: hypothetical protein ACTJFR_04970 [Canibacter sp.]
MLNPTLGRQFGTQATPFHSLSTTDAPRVPSWVGRRQVVRSGDRTFYLLDTWNLEAAQSDLDSLTSNGWSISVDSRGNMARVTLTQDDVARAA